MFNYRVVQAYLLRSSSNYAPLYHYTTVAKAKDIMSTNSLKPGGLTGYSGVCLTRNARGLYMGHVSTFNVRFVLDASKLRTKYKLYKVNEFKNDPADVYYHPNDIFGGNKIPGAPLSSRYRSESEERIKGSIENLNSYVIRVDVTQDAYDELMHESRKRPVDRKRYENVISDPSTLEANGFKRVEWVSLDEQIEGMKKTYERLYKHDVPLPEMYKKLRVVDRF